jgi:hypothetical protein
MNQIHASAGQRVAVIRRAFSSVPMDYRFSARAAIPGETPGGTDEIRKSRWILPGSPANPPLQPSNIVSAAFWNTFVSVDIVPEVDAIVTVEGRSIRHLRWLLLSGLLVVLAAAGVMVFGP